MKKSEDQHLSSQTFVRKEKSGSISTQLENIDEALNIFSKDHYGSCVKVFAAKWQELCEAYGYTEDMVVTFLAADHPYPQPVFPIQVMDKELYMTNHYASVAEWKKNPKRPMKFEVIEIKRDNAIGGIFISGTLIKYTLFQAFLGICSFTTTLSVVGLNDCSLKKESIMSLADCLSGTQVTHLYLDSNPLPDEDYSCILKDNTTLIHLSLALCKIGRRGLKALADVLGPFEGSRPNQCLKSLVLDNNRIDCLAMKCFAEVNQELNLPIVEIPNREIDIFELENDCLNNLSDKNIIMAGVDRVRMHVLQKTCDEFLEADPNPIVADVYLANGKLISAGNCTLHSLNVSFNKIGQTGFMHLLRALREQKLAESTRDTSKKNHYLKLIEYMGNPCPEDSIILKKIVYYLKQSNLDKEDYPGTPEPCTCLPIRKPKLDRDTLLIIDRMVDYFKPGSKLEEEGEESDSERIEEFECCNEFGEEEEEESFSEEGERSEESSEDEMDPELAEILEDVTGDHKLKEEEIDEECKDSEDEEEEQEEEEEEEEEDDDDGDSDDETTTYS